MKHTQVSRLEAIMSILVIALLAVAYGIAVSAPMVGFFHDDGVYLVTAKSLAESGEYRIESLPGSPPQTKYPVLFPLTLAVVWRVFPGFPDNVFFLKLVPLLSTLLWMILLFRFFREHASSSRMPLWIVLLTAASPWVLFLSAIFLAEALFACLCTAALLAFHRWESQAYAVSTKLILVCGLLAGAAFLTRTAGVALIAAGIASVMLKRQVGAAAWFVVVCLFLVSPWLVWQAAHSGDNAQSFAYYSSSNYQDWNIVFGFTAGQKVTIFLSNLSRLLVSPIPLLGYMTPNANALFFLLTIDGLILIGFVGDVLKGGVRPLHLFAVFYCGIILLWASPSARFMVPVLPFLLFFAYKGMVIVLRQIAMRQAVSPAVAGVVVALLLLGEGYTLARVAGNAAANGLVSLNVAEPGRWKDLNALLGWIRNNTSPNSVLQAKLDPAIYLYTGRKAIRGYTADPFELSYAANPYLPLGKPSDFGWQLVHHRVNYVVRTPSHMSSERRRLNELTHLLMSEFPAAFTLVYVGPDPDYRVYEVDHEALAQTLPSSPRY
jgi:hypothetical protein